MIHDMDLRFITYIKKRRGIYPRHPIFINLKSNTMKNTLQRYGFSRNLQ